MKIGVLALQGAFIEHQRALDNLGFENIQVKKKEQLDEINGLIIPGGESTTIGKLLFQFDILNRLIEKANKGMPIFGTCAGAILLSNEIVGSNQIKLSLMNMVVERNAFGRQIDSFETHLKIKDLENSFKAVFIRAPIIKSVGPEVKILAKHDENIVFVRQNNYLALSFHPELTEDLRIHEMFVNMCR